MDEQKKQRYRRVYTRLRDFERFLSERGVDTSLQSRNVPPRREKPAALMTDEEALDVLRLVCVEHNIRLMDRLTGLRSFAQLLEQARGETDWRRLRRSVILPRGLLPRRSGKRCCALRRFQPGPGS